MSPKLSIISHYYNHPEMVQSQIAYWETLPDYFLSQVEFILVDDCSEKTPVIRPTNLRLKVYRVITDLPWNQAGARNLGAFNASGEWALYFDIDQRFYADPMAAVVANLDRLDKMGLHYLKIKELIDITVNKSLACHPNSFLVNLAMFKQHAMYDEDFVGHYGYEDLYMPQVWEKQGGKRIVFNDMIFFRGHELRHHQPESRPVAESSAGATKDGRWLQAPGRHSAFRVGADRHFERLRPVALNAPALCKWKCKSTLIKVGPRQR